jgi:hypothetical protein
VLNHPSYYQLRDQLIGFLEERAAVCSAARARHSPQEALGSCPDARLETSSVFSPAGRGGSDGFERE